MDDYFDRGFLFRIRDAQSTEDVAKHPMAHLRQNLETQTQMYIIGNHTYHRKRDQLEYVQKPTAIRANANWLRKPTRHTLLRMR